MEEEIQVKKELKRVVVVTAILLAVLIAIWVVDLKSEVIENLGKSFAGFAHFE